MITTIYYIAIGLLLSVLTYVCGVQIGKRYTRRELIPMFDNILKNLLHYASTKDYAALHLSLQELCGDESVLKSLRYQYVLELADDEWFCSKNPNVSADLIEVVSPLSSKSGGPDSV